MSEDLADVYLRFDGFEGECNDSKHPGDKGWITIKSFSFGFGFPGQDEVSGADDDDDDTTDSTGNAAKTANKPKKKKKKKKSSMKSGPLTFDRITFTKSSDSTSCKLMEWCHEGKEVAVVDLEACRYGGALGDEKLPFLHISFQNVYLKSCKLNLTTDNLPSEDIEFEYEKVNMKCLWTDNATGNRLTSQPIGVGWDLGKQDAINDLPPDDED